MIFLKGSPFNRADLNAVNANLAAMVVVLSPIVQPDSIHNNQALADKESIMASLNLKAMPFDDVTRALPQEKIAHIKSDDETGLSQRNRFKSLSKLKEVSGVLPMITELGQ